MARISIDENGRADRPAYINPVEGGHLKAVVKVYSGRIECAGESLGHRDGMGINGAGHLSLHATDTAEALLIEVPVD